MVVASTAAIARAQSSASDPSAGVASLREGRRLAAAGHYAEALAVLLPVVDAAPSDWALRCETGFVALEADDVTRASTLIRAAVALAPSHPTTDALRRSVSACQYNAGRVDEAAGHIHAAREHYRMASATRPNDAIDRRVALLDARLHGQPSLEALEAEICRQAFDSPYPCHFRLVTQGCCDDDESEDDSDEITAPVARGPLTYAQVVVVTSGMPSDDPEEPDQSDPDAPLVAVFVVDDASGWALAGELGALDPRGAYEEPEVTMLTFSQLVPGGDDELRLSLDRSWSERIAGTDGRTAADYHGESITETVICALVDGTTRCASWVTDWAGDGRTCSTSLRVVPETGVLTTRRTGRDTHCAASRSTTLSAAFSDPHLRLRGLFDPR